MDEDYIIYIPAFLGGLALFMTLVIQMSYLSTILQIVIGVAAFIFNYKLNECDVYSKMGLIGGYVGVFAAFLSFAGFIGLFRM